jgi:hypothetical protein
MAFSVAVEMLNIRIRGKQRDEPVKLRKMIDDEEPPAPRT